jgi:hypothetical protein
MDNGIGDVSFDRPVNSHGSAKFPEPAPNVTQSETAFVKQSELI